MITHTCTASLPADVAALVEHLAYCPSTPPELVSVCRDLIRTAAEGARFESRNVPAATSAKVERSRKTLVRSCERCGNTFETTNVRKRFCSTPCRSGRHRERSGGAA